MAHNPKESVKLYRHIDDIKPAPFNPRSITTSDMKRLKSQILTLGQYKPVLVKKGDDPLILGGNMRHRAYKDLIQEYQAGGAEALQRAYSFNKYDLIPLKKIQKVMDELIDNGVWVSLVKAEDRARETEYMFSDNDHATNTKKRV